MSFIRHVGKHGDRKVAIIFREVPGEPHMCLVTYTELLNQNVHDPMMQCIESDIGQNSENLADALNRSYTRDGKILLHVLHTEGLLKKVNTELVVMTPAPNTNIKLNELNTILNEMKQGEEATRKLADMDKNLGMTNSRDVVNKLRGNQKQPEATPPVGNGVLSDAALAQQRIQQAKKFEMEAKSLLSEAKRLMEEATQLDASVSAPEAAVTIEATAKVTKPRKSRTKVTV